MYKYSVLIGRFQIPTYAHFHLIKEALKVSETVIIAIGSVNLPRTLRNPFNMDQRAMMIENCGDPEINKAVQDNRIVFVGLEDSPYSDVWWVEHVQRQVGNVTKLNPGNVVLVGCNKDATSYYLQMFPQWDMHTVDKFGDFNATDCRNAYYEFGPHDRSVYNKLSELTTQGVIAVLKLFPRQIHESLHARWREVQEYRQKWGEGPFHASDAVVYYRGNILCIRRKGESFNNNLWALPGGFLDKDEHYCSSKGVRDSQTALPAIRELKEETGLELSIEHVDDQCYFEKQDRDDRAWIMSNAIFFNISDMNQLPPVKGADDAELAEWVPMADLCASNMYADHYFIVRKFVDRIR